VFPANSFAILSPLSVIETYIEVKFLSEWSKVFYLDLFNYQCAEFFVISVYE